MLEDFVSFCQSENTITVNGRNVQQMQKNNEFKFASWYVPTPIYTMGITGVVYIYFGLGVAVVFEHSSAFQVPGSNAGNS